MEFAGFRAIDHICCIIEEKAPKQPELLLDFCTDTDLISGIDGHQPVKLSRHGKNHS